MPTGQVLLIVLVVVLGIIALLIISGVRIVTQTKKYVVERLGAYHATWGVGIHWLIPFVDRVVSVVSLKEQDRKSTRLNSSHVRISYAVFCLKKKKRKNE